MEWPLCDPGPSPSPPHTEDVESQNSVRVQVTQRRGKESHDLFEHAATAFAHPRSSCKALVASHLTSLLIGHVIAVLPEERYLSEKFGASYIALSSPSPPVLLTD